MRRRKFIALAGRAAAGWLLGGHFAIRRGFAAETAKTIGVLSPFTRSDTQTWHQAFREGLRDLGWVEEENIKIEYRYADGVSERLPELAADLVKRNVAIIVVAVTPDALAAAHATKTIPIVMASAGDPVGAGLAQSLAKPGGNVTGLSQMSTDLAGKRLELMREIVPDLSRIGVLRNPRDAISTITWQEIQTPAKRLSIELRSLELHDVSEFDQAFVTAINEKIGGLYTLPAPIFVDNEKRIVDFATRNRLPSVFHLPEFVRLGGLMAYGPDRAALFRRAATYVDKILRGANPGDLPIEQPTKFELAINLRTAKSLNFAIPQSLILRADEVVE
jgi:putative ABC transport system substrate-binding protein